MARNDQPCGEADGRGGPVPDEHPGGLPVASRRGQDGVQGLHVGRCGDVAGYAEVVAQVAGADEQHVDPVDGGDVVGGGDRGRGLDLHHAQRLVVSPVQRLGVEPEAAGPVVGGDPAIAGRRVAQMGQRGLHLCGAVQPGQHDASGPGVQRPSDADPFRRLDADESGDAVAARGRDHVADLLFPAGAVLEVEQHPVEPGRRAHLGADRGGHADERAERRPPTADGRGQGAAIERGGGGGAHPNHRWAWRPAS